MVAKSLATHGEVRLAYAFRNDFFFQQGTKGKVLRIMRWRTNKGKTGAK